MESCFERSCFEISSDIELSCFGLQHPGCIHFHVQNPMTSTVASQVLTTENRLPRLSTYNTQCARARARAARPIRIGDSQLATVAAVPPANPSRDNVAAAVQLGTRETAPSPAPRMPANRDAFFGDSSFIGFNAPNQRSRSRQTLAAGNVCRVQ